MANRYFNGDRGSVVIGATTFAVTQWAATYDHTLIDVTGSTDDGFHRNIAGRKKLSGSLTANLDLDNTPWAGTLMLTDDDAANSAALTLHMKDGADSGQTIAVSTARFSQVAINSQVGNVVTFTVNWEASGTFTLPS